MYNYYVSNVNTKFFHFLFVTSFSYWIVINSRQNYHLSAVYFEICMYMYMYWQQKIGKIVSIIVYINIYYKKNTTAVDVMAKIRLVSIAIKLKLLPL